MDVLVSLNGMLIKGLECGLRCKDHLQLQNVPLEISVISAETWPSCLAADASCSTELCNLPQTKAHFRSMQPEYRGKELLCVRA